jgi:hypothetical protein
MEDRFEKFISGNREKFDSLEPEPAVWKKIEAGLRIQHRFDWRLVMKRAAVVLVIFMTSYGVNELVHQLNGKGLTARKSARSEKGNNIPGLIEAEAYYTSVVNQKLDELKPIIANCPSLEEELQFDLSELDSVYLDLKSDLKDNMANQEVIEAIIENYRFKISILEDILSELTPMGDECVPKSNGYAL